LTSPGAETPASAVATAAPPRRAPITVAVERIALEDRLVTRGTVRSAGATAYIPPSSSAAGARLEVLRQPGDSVAAGDAVALVDGRPVLLLVGDSALGADVRPTSTGRDVERLQAGLRNLGLSIDPGESGRFGPTSQAAVTALYERAGFQVPTTTEPLTATGGESLSTHLARLRRAVESARATLAAAEAAAASPPDPVGQAQLALLTARRKVTEAESARSAGIGDAMVALAEARRHAATTSTAPVAPGGGVTFEVSPVATAEQALRDAIRLGDAGVADATEQALAAELQVADATRSAFVEASGRRLQVDTARSGLAAAEDDLAEAERRDGVVVPRSDILFVPQLPTTVLTVGSTVAASGSAFTEPSGPLVTLRSGELVVDVDVPSGVRIQPGAVGTADADDGSVVLQIAAPDGDDGVDGGATGTATFEITGATTGSAVAGDNLRVTVSTPVTSDEVLAVPLRAITTDRRGRELVRVVSGPRVREVEVRAGRSGGGMVELLGADGGPLDGVQAGDRVRIS